MLIAVNTRLLLPGKLEGIGWFAAETLKRITKSHPEHQFLFIFDRPFSDEFIFSDNVTPVMVSPQSRHPVLWYIWLEHSLPKVLRNRGADIFFSPDGYLPLKIKIPAVSVIHDINFMHRPDFHPLLTRSYYRYFFPRFAAKAERVVTVSEFSRIDIANTFGISESKVDVVYNGAGTSYTPLSANEKEIARDNLTGGRDYFLYVGSLNKRKNICGLLDAYERFRTESGKEIKLVLAGERMYSYPELSGRIEKMRFGEDVIFKGRMEPPDLRKAYGAATALVYIPFYEGFGIPLLEAMYCDTPVIASNITSIPEVAGDAAILVDPYDTGSIVKGMLRLTGDMDLRDSLIARGRVRRKLFSWDRTSDLLWQSIEKVISFK